MTAQIAPQMQRLLQLLGMARRAGKIAQGFDAATAAMQMQTAAMVCIAGDCAERTVRNVRRVARETDTAVMELSCTREQLGQSIGCAPTGVLVITDHGFAKKARALIPENMESIKEENVL